MTTYYVRPADDHPENGDGLLYATAFSGLDKVNSGFTLSPGDTLYICGMHDAGWNGSRFLLQQDGAEGNKITIRGDYPDDPGHLWCCYDRIPIGSTWTDAGFGAYYRVSGSNTQRKLFEDWAYLPLSGWRDAPPDDTWGPGDFYHDQSDDRLYVYATTGVPSDHIYHTRASQPLYLVDRWHFVIKNLKLSNSDSSNTGLLALQYSRFWLLDGLELENSPFAVAIRNASHDGEIKNCVVHENGNSIYAISSTKDGAEPQTDRLWVHHNLIYNTGIDEWNGSGTDHHGCGFMGGDDILVEHNEIHTQAGSGITMFTWSGVHTANNYTVRYNFVHDINAVKDDGTQGNLRGIDCSFHNAEYLPQNHLNWQWYGNVVVRCSDVALRPQVNYYNGQAQMAVYNNTVVSCGGGISYHTSGTGVDAPGGPFYEQGVITKNNLVIDTEIITPSYTRWTTPLHSTLPSASPPAIYSGHDWNYNMFDPDGADKFRWSAATYASFAAYQAASGMDAASSIDDPLLVNKAGSTIADFALDAGSPALAAGTPVGIAYDINGDPYNLQSPSLGAIESGAAPVTTTSNILNDQFNTLALTLDNETVDETGDGATLTIDSNSDAGTLYSYSKTTAFTGTDEENAAEIIANGVGQVPVVGENARVVTGQDSLTPYYAGWVQDAGTVESNVVLVQYTTLDTPVAPVQAQQYPDRTSYNGSPVNLDFGDPYWTSNAGAMTYREVGLPGGLTLDVNTGIVTGTPNTNTVAQVDIYAANSEGETGPAEFQWSVIATPVVVPPEGAGLSLSLSLWV